MYAIRSYYVGELRPFLRIELALQQLPLELAVHLLADLVQGVLALLVRGLLGLDLSYNFV